MASSDSAEHKRITASFGTQLIGILVFMNYMRTIDSKKNH